MVKKWILLSAAIASGSKRKEVLDLGAFTHQPRGGERTDGNVRMVVTTGFVDNIATPPKRDIYIYT
jgi:hypothetical protein